MDGLVQADLSLLEDRGKLLRVYHLRVPISSPPLRLYSLKDSYSRCLGSREKGPSNIVRVMAAASASRRPGYMPQTLGK